MKSPTSITGDGPTSGVLAARLILPIPPEFQCPFGDLSRGQPRFQIQVLSAMILDSREVVEDVRLVGSPPFPSPEEAAPPSPYTLRVEILRQSPRTRVYRRHGTECPLMASFQEHGLLPNYPFRIENGRYNILVTGTSGQVQALYLSLKKEWPDISIESIHHLSGDGNGSLLTPHQADIFRTALSAGYWDVPRRTNLSELSQRLSVTRSTLSHLLAQIESKLLHEAREVGNGLPQT